MVDYFGWCGLSMLFRACSPNIVLPETPLIYCFCLRSWVCVILTQLPNVACSADFPIGLPADQIWTLSVPVTVSIHGGEEAPGAVVPLASRVPLAGKLMTSSHALKFRPDWATVIALTGAGSFSHTVPTSGTGIHFSSPTQFYSVDFSQSRCSVKKCVFNRLKIKVCVGC